MSKTNGWYCTCIGHSRLSIDWSGGGARARRISYWSNFQSLWCLFINSTPLKGNFHTLCTTRAGWIKKWYVGAFYDKIVLVKIFFFDILLGIAKQFLCTEIGPYIMSCIFIVHEISPLLLFWSIKVPLWLYSPCGSYSRTETTSILKCISNFKFGALSRSIL